jgi:hypothetical protein
MTFTCVSVGSGKASTVRLRNETYPQTATTAVKNSTAPRFFRENATIFSNMVAPQPARSTWLSKSSAPFAT